MGQRPHRRLRPRVERLEAKRPLNAGAWAPALHSAGTSGAHRVAGGGPLPTGGRDPGRDVSTGTTSPGPRSAATSPAG